MPRAQRTPWIARENDRPNWYIYSYDEHTTRVTRRSARTCIRSEAESALAQFLIKRAAEKQHLSPVASPDQYLIATAIRWYLQERAPEIVSKERAAISCEYLLKFFGANTSVASLTPQLVKQYCACRKRKVRYVETKTGRKKIEINRPLSSATVRRELNVLSAAINHAVSNGRLNYAPKIFLPPNAPHRTRYLDREEIERLLDNCIEQHLRLFVLLALNTASRKGALLDLRWPQVDMVKRMIDLNPDGRIQTNKKRAIVPINDTLYTALEDAKNKAVEAHRKRIEKREHSQLCPYVLTYHNAPLQNIRHGFMRACARAGIVGVTPHTLRHTAGTIMALAGVDLFLIAKVLGHSVQKTTELYAHHRPEYLRSAMQPLSLATRDGIGTDRL